MTYVNRLFEGTGKKKKQNKKKQNRQDSVSERKEAHVVRSIFTLWPFSEDIFLIVM